MLELDVSGGIASPSGVTIEKRMRQKRLADAFQLLSKSFLQRAAPGLPVLAAVEEVVETCVKYR